MEDMIRDLLGQVSVLTAEHEAICNVLMTPEQKRRLIVEHRSICRQQNIDPVTGHKLPHN